MKTRTVLMVLSGLALATVGGAYIYKKVNMPKLISFNRLKETVTYNFKGQNRTAKLLAKEALSLGTGGYYIESLLNNDGAIVGAVLKSEGGGIINAL